MYALEACHARGFLLRLTGACNDAKREVNRCLRKERLQRTKENFERGREKRELTKRLWDEVDRNS
jgi:COX assembly protein 2